MFRIVTAIALSSTCVLWTITASVAGGGHSAPYAGQDQREVKSLSRADLDSLRRGLGWGLAKAAELNGVPGPLHVLELAEALKLTAEQKKKTESIYVEMRTSAQELGHRLIEEEKQVDQFFQTGAADHGRLKQLVSTVGHTRSELRLVHLRAHLHMRPILTPKQLALYNELRGYDSAPCQAVPPGHDAEMWHRHNGCLEH